MGKLPKSSKKSTGQLTKEQGTLGGSAFGGYRGWFVAERRDGIACSREVSWLAVTLSCKAGCCGSAFDPMM